jgi:hypothetical protein
LRQQGFMVHVDDHGEVVERHPMSGDATPATTANPPSTARGRPSQLDRRKRPSRWRGRDLPHR